VKIDIVSDVVCPWCFIGKRHLEEALARWAAESPVAIEVEWQPYELNPDLPPEGADRKSYLENKFGGPERATQIYDRVRAAGRTAGIAFEFDRIVRQPNTLAAHRLISAAPPGDAQTALVERLFRGYFLEGADLTRHDVLVGLAGEAGMPTPEAEAALRDEARERHVRAAEFHAQRMGVSGVPFFIVDRRFALSGAQPPDVILGALRHAASAPSQAAQQ
jgi:predicted DsbA family dithiol-disulfide isomerase